MGKRSPKNTLVRTSAHVCFSAQLKLGVTLNKRKIRTFIACMTPFFYLFFNKRPNPMKHLSEQAPKRKLLFLNKHPGCLISHLRCMFFVECLNILNFFSDCVDLIKNFFNKYLYSCLQVACLDISLTFFWSFFYLLIFF